jgi:5-amino-6-(5-phospho-D-ribitylamino)uracil phosphatase
MTLPLATRGLALDIDGTLVREDGKIPSKLARSLQCCWNRLTVILASARPAQGIQHILRQLERDGPYVALNGGIVSLSSASTPLFVAELPLFTKKELLKGVSQSSGLIDGIFAYDKERWYAWGSEVVIDREQRLVKMAPSVVTEIAHFEKIAIIKLTVVCNTEPACLKIGTLLGQLDKAVLSLQTSKSGYLEITPYGISKGEGLARLTAALPLSSIIAIGDGRNDIEMFAQASVSYAMPWSAEETKASATFVLREPGVESLVDILEGIT